MKNPLSENETRTLGVLLPALLVILALCLAASFCVPHS